MNHTDKDQFYGQAAAEFKHDAAGLRQGIMHRFASKTPNITTLRAIELRMENLQRSLALETKARTRIMGIIEEVDAGSLNETNALFLINRIAQTV